MYLYWWLGLALFSDVTSNKQPCLCTCTHHFLIVVFAQTEWRNRAAESSGYFSRGDCERQMPRCAQDPPRFPRDCG